MCGKTGKSSNLQQQIHFCPYLNGEEINSNIFSHISAMQLEALINIARRCLTGI